MRSCTPAVDPPFTHDQSRICKRCSTRITMAEGNIYRAPVKPTYQKTRMGERTGIMQKGEWTAIRKILTTVIPGRPGSTPATADYLFGTISRYQLPGRWPSVTLGSPPPRVQKPPQAPQLRSLCKSAVLFG